jgi:hypothetical protein
MANSAFFVSTLVLGAVHILAILWCRIKCYLLVGVILTGLMTSAWNHRATSATARAADRLTMRMCFSGDMYLIWSLRNRGHWWVGSTSAALIGAVVLYGVSKVYDRRLHLLAHLSLTISHLLMLAALHDDRPQI